MIKTAFEVGSHNLDSLILLWNPRQEIHTDVFPLIIEPFPVLPENAPRFSCASCEVKQRKERPGQALLMEKRSRRAIQQLTSCVWLIYSKCRESIFDQATCIPDVVVNHGSSNLMISTMCQLLSLAARSPALFS